MERLIKNNRCHYIKFELEDMGGLSLRYHYLNQAAPASEGRYTLKHHKDNVSTLVDERFASKIISKHCGRIVEVVSWMVPRVNGLTGLDQQRVVISDEFIDQQQGSRHSGGADILLKRVKSKLRRPVLSAAEVV